MLIRLYFAWRACIFYFLLHFIEVYEVHAINICFLIVIIIFEMLQKVEPFLVNFLRFLYNHFAVIFFGKFVAFQACVIESLILIDL